MKITRFGITLLLCLSLLSGVPGKRTALQSTWAAGAGPVLRLHRATFNARIPGTHAPTRAWATKSPGPYSILQLRGPITIEDRKALAATGIALLEYLPDYAYLVRGTPAQIQTAAGLPQVYARTDFTLADKLAPVLLGALESDTTTPYEVRVVGWAHAQTTLEHELETLGKGTQFTGNVSDLLSVAQLSSVRWIEPVSHPRLLNDYARTIMNVHPVWQNYGLYGEGEIIAVADSGLDTGDIATLSPDFAGRIVATHVLSPGGQWDDNFGHGTHVAGSIAGAGVQSGSDPAQHDYETSFAGIAPEAGLVVQAFEALSDGSVVGLPDDYYQIFDQAYSDGARIHSNSWGGTSGPPTDTEALYGGYTFGAQRTDEFIWEHPDMSIFFAAGNSGADGTPAPPFGFCSGGDGVVDPDSLLTPGTAKNVITVGATESNRSSGGYGAYPWLLVACVSVDPIATDTVADNTNGMAAFSSRGPVDDGRYKPDLVAPGTNIVSNKSHHPDINDTYWPSPETYPDYAYSNGTSMATPLTAGAGALVRQWLQAQGMVTPTAAMLKAVLLNTTEDIAPGQYGTGTTQEVPYEQPNNVAGWGRASLTFIDAEAPYHLWMDDHTGGLSTNEIVTYTDAEMRPLEVLSNSLPLRVMLTWTDPPASLSAASQLVNDLDLRVIGPNGSIYYGNDTGGGDRINNVEGIVLDTPDVGVYTVTIAGFNVPTATQPYALAVSGALITSSVTVAPTASFLSSSPDTLGQTTTFTNTSSGTMPIQYAWDFGDGLTSTLTSPTHVYTSTGTYTVTLVATNADGSDTATASITILPPGAPVAGFTSSSPDILGQTTTFANISSGTAPMDYHWDFGDGATSALASPTHVYASTGDFTVTLTVTDTYGSDTAYGNVTILPVGAPIAGFTSSSPDILGQTTTFTNTSSGDDLSFAWDFGDGSPISSVEHPTHTYTSADTYSVTLTVSNTYGSSSTTGNVVIAPESCIPARDAAFSRSPLTPTLETAQGAPVTFSGTATGTLPISFQWAFGDGSSGSGETVMHTYMAAGTYTVTLNVSNLCGADAASAVLTVEGTPAEPHRIYLPVVIRQ